MDSRTTRRLRRKERDRILAEEWQAMKRALEQIARINIVTFASKEEFLAAASNIEFWKDKMEEVVQIANITLTNIQKARQMQNHPGTSQKYGATHVRHN